MQHDYNQEALDLHRANHGKIEVTAKVPIVVTGDPATEKTEGMERPT